MADPYVLDIPAMTGDVAATLAQLWALRREITVTPRPNYRVHGHDFAWQDLLDWLNRAIAQCQQELVYLSPYEIVSVAR